MAMGIVSDEDFDKQLEQLNNKKEVGKVVDIKRGRGIGDKEVPESLRKIIGDTAITDNSEGRKLAEAFDISNSSVSAYKQGATSTSSYNSPDNELAKHVSNVKDRIATKARSKLIAALNGITPKKLEDVKVRELAAIAKDMSAVVKNIEPQVQEKQDNKVQFVFFAPHVRKEEEYSVIEMRDE